MKGKKEATHRYESKGQWPANLWLSSFTSLLKEYPKTSSSQILPNFYYKGAEWCEENTKNDKRQKGYWSRSVEKLYHRVWCLFHSFSTVEKLYHRAWCLLSFFLHSGEALPQSLVSFVILSPQWRSFTTELGVLSSFLYSGEALPQSLVSCHSFSTVEKLYHRAWCLLSFFLHSGEALPQSLVSCHSFSTVEKLYHRAWCLVILSPQWRSFTTELGVLSFFLHSGEALPQSLVSCHSFSSGEALPQSLVSCHSLWIVKALVLHVCSLFLKSDDFFVILVCSLTIQKISWLL